MLYRLHDLVSLVVNSIAEAHCWICPGVQYIKGFATRRNRFVDIKTAAISLIVRTALTISSLRLLLEPIMLLDLETDNVEAALKASTDKYEV